tara:strand:- start:506 stop:1768 length:1263 start_codon:yes stop_codon:yes gene_type:complete
MSEKKKKILVLSDHPLSPSGVGTQTRYVIQALLETGRYKVLSFGGAIKHQDYRPVRVDPYGDDWIIQPVNGYGTPEMIRSTLRFEKPDAIWIMTDPRFWGWLWEIEDEIRSLVPLVYYHVWDNYPLPVFNKANYTSNDVIACISKLTHEVVKGVAPEVESHYLPHAVDSKVFCKKPKADVEALRKNSFGDEINNKFIVFWNNRNARRKQSGSLIFWFKKFLDIIGHENACLIMHTDVYDPNGQDLTAIVDSLGLINGEVKFSTNKIPPEHLALIYNMADCTINVSDAEGFGLATLESLSCETPIIVNMTGGLQEQVTDGEKAFGVGIRPSSKAVIGSQDIPFIYEDRVNEDGVVDALLTLYSMSQEDRDELGRLGREHVEKNYNFSDFNKKWVELMDNTLEKHGSWETRKNYKSYDCLEV